MTAGHHDTLPSPQFQLHPSRGNENERTNNVNVTPHYSCFTSESTAQQLNTPTPTLLCPPWLSSIAGKRGRLLLLLLLPPSASASVCLLPSLRPKVPCPSLSLSLSHAKEAGEPKGPTPPSSTPPLLSGSAFLLKNGRGQRGRARSGVYGSRHGSHFLAVAFNRSAA